MKLSQGSKHQKPAEFPAWSPIWFLHRSGFQGPEAPCCQIGCFMRGDFMAPTPLSLGRPRCSIISGRKHKSAHRWIDHETQWRGSVLQRSALETTHSTSCYTIRFCRISPWLCFALELIWSNFIKTKLLPKTESKF